MSKQPISQAEYKVDERCPVCGDNQVDGDSVDISNGQATQNITCSYCGSYWTDVYRLQKYDNLHDEEGNELEVPEVFGTGAFCGAGAG